MVASRWITVDSILQCLPGSYHDTVCMKTNFCCILQIKQTVTLSMMVESDCLFFNPKCRNTSAVAFVFLMMSKLSSILFDYSTGEGRKSPLKLTGQWIVEYPQEVHHEK